MKRIKVIVEKTSTGYSAYAQKYPVITTGETPGEIRRNITEALNLYFEDQEITISSANLSIEIDLHQFFEFYSIINAKGLAARIGMNHTLLNQYIRGVKKPSKKQTEKILEGIHEVGQELTGVNLL